jgi:hypothetical protein
MTMLPSLVLWHMIFAEGLSAVLTLLVLLRCSSTFITFFQVSNQPRTETIRTVILGGLSLSLDRAHFSIMIPL